MAHLIAGVSPPVRLPAADASNRGRSSIAETTKIGELGLSGSFWFIGNREIGTGAWCRRHLGGPVLAVGSGE